MDTEISIWLGELGSKPQGLDREGKAWIKWTTTFKKSQEDEKSAGNKTMEKVIVNGMETYLPTVGLIIKVMKF